ncbi:MAG TPA: glutathione transferase GstA [Burkholderiales bacterium]|nr:glutathione transferase GstA [Burkholderiales bacterium]
MKLYYSPGACSMAVDIALHEAGTAFEMEKVDLAARKTAAGEDYTRINPKGYVPALRLDNGQLLTEVAVILQYVADQKPDSGLAPKAGTMERYRLMEWLNFVSSEIHKQFSPLWNPKTPEETRQMQKDRLAGRFDWLSKELDGKPFLMDGQFTVADAYLFTVLNWTHILKIDLGRWPKLKDYMARVAARPKVQETMKAEGLVK